MTTSFPFYNLKTTTTHTHCHRSMLTRQRCPGSPQCTMSSCSCERMRLSRGRSPFARSWRSTRRELCSTHPHKSWMEHHPTSRRRCTLQVRCFGRRTFAAAVVDIAARGERARRRESRGVTADRASQRGDVAPHEMIAAARLMRSRRHISGRVEDHTDFSRGALVGGRWTCPMALLPCAP